MGCNPYGCKCQTLAKKLTGDGCDICNPELAEELNEDGKERGEDMDKDEHDEMEALEDGISAMEEKLKIYREALEEVDTYLDNAPTVRAIVRRALGNA